MRCGAVAHVHRKVFVCILPIPTKYIRINIYIQTHRHMCTPAHEFFFYDKKIIFYFSSSSSQVFSVVGGWRFKDFSGDV